VSPESQAAAIRRLAWSIRQAEKMLAKIREEAIAYSNQRHKSGTRPTTRVVESRPPMPTRKRANPTRAAQHMREKRAAETQHQRETRVRKMRDAARRKARLRLRHRRTPKGSNPPRRSRRDAIERDALTHGASIVTADTLRRPKFIVITPAGRRIETLEPDVA